MRPLGDGFIKLIRMMIAPIIFGTVVVGIAKMGDMKEVGRIGLTRAHLLRGRLHARARHRPGRGQRPAARRRHQRGSRHARRHDRHGLRAPRRRHLSDDRLPDEHHPDHGRGCVCAAATSCRCCSSRCSSAWRCSTSARRGSGLVGIIDEVTHACSASSAMIMRVAPIGAFGAMAFTIGQYGIGTLFSLGKLMAGVYIDVPAVHLRRARRHRRLGRLQPVEVPQVHQGRDPDRARHRRRRNRCCRA